MVAVVDRQRPVHRLAGVGAVGCQRGVVREHRQCGLFRFGVVDREVRQRGLGDVVAVTVVADVSSGKQDGARFR